MTKLLGSLALLAALCLPAAAAETVLCRVSGYPAPTTCSTQPALLGSSLPVAPGTATAGVATFAAREDHRHPLQAKSYTLLTSGSGTYTVPANVTICDVSATGGGGGGGGSPGATGGTGGTGGTVSAVNIAGGTVSPVALLACLGRQAVMESQQVLPCLERVGVAAVAVELAQLVVAVETVETVEAMALVVVAVAVLRLDLTQGLAAMVHPAT